KGIAGAAWNAQLMHINAGCSWSARNICYGYEGILAAAANGADIINASWGGYVPWDGRARFAEQSLDLATDMGSLIVAAAGNSSFDLDVIRDYPARHPRVLSVGATEKDTRKIVGFSNYGKLVNVFAPGARVATTGLNNDYFYVYGTSFSSPLVAGIAALVKTQNPSWSPDQLREQIRVTSDNIDRINPSYDGQTGRGYVNASKALAVPSAPGIRLVKWSWTDGDDDLLMSPNDEITITVELVNHLSDASQLTVGLTNAESYPYLEWLTQSVNVGTLNGGDTTKVDLKFKVGANAPANQRIRLFTDIRNGTFSDQADMLSFQLNQRIELLHQALKSLYTATNGDAWTKKTNWDISKVPSESEFSSWYGVGFSERRLFLLDLSENNLSGTLPTNLSNLRQLEILNLYDNALTGPIPSELGQLSELNQLYIENNSLTGSLPSELGNLSKMQKFDVSNNNLSGNIPSQLTQLSEMELLRLNNNSFTGPIPSGLNNLSNLNDLWLSHNSLTDGIPANLGQLTGLTILALHYNSLTGAIPTSLGNLGRLEVLTISNNSLTGGIPTQLGGLSRLEYLWLSSNSLTGGIPSELANLVSVQDLRLHNNSLSDAIPSQLGNLSELQTLTLHGNSLTGQIPSELGKLSNLKILTLSDNSLTGSVPSELGNLSNLQQLYLSNNSLTGELPRSFLKLKNLKKLFFKGQDLCAPQDAEFLAWLNSIDEVDSVPCNDNNTNLIVQEISDQSFVRGNLIDPMVLPEASIGTPPFIYTLSPPLPRGLTFDPAQRIISGTPTEVSPPISLTYIATDNSGFQGSQQFTIEIIASVGTESESLPEKFALHSNYPNPFRNSTHLVFDLPWTASIEVEVMDITGRQVYVQPATEMSPGWGREIKINGITLPSGSYIYRMTAISTEGSSVHIGNFVRIR
ncbi:MAG: S8 family serine peptidase, partial [Bacteroidetes bacterium]|nr:S8 family serine peptidase [Bacteroidota bacterium]